MKTLEAMRSRWKSLLSATLTAGLLGTAAGVALYPRTAPADGDCCAPGSPCCHPGAPCCLRHHHAARR